MARSITELRRPSRVRRVVSALIVVAVAVFVLVHWQTVLSVAVLIALGGLVLLIVVTGILRAVFGRSGGLLATLLAAIALVVSLRNNRR